MEAIKTNMLRNVKVGLIGAFVVIEGKIFYDYEPNEPSKATSAGLVECDKSLPHKICMHAWKHDMMSKEAKAEFAKAKFRYYDMFYHGQVMFSLKERKYIVKISKEICDFETRQQIAELFCLGHKKVRWAII